MVTRLNYALPIARQLLVNVGRRLRPGGLAASLPHSAEGRPFVIVTGAGRSGTSAVARVLHESGVRMGEDFDASSEFNPLGFYQEIGLYVANEQILTELGMAGIWRLDRWRWRSTVLAVAANYREEMQALIDRATDGWKDPIFAITLEAWLPLLPARPKLVVCLRSPRAYADSVTRIFGLVDPETAERQWARHYRRLLDVIRDYKLEATCVEYDALVDRPKETTADLAEFIGHPLKAEYVEPPLRRFTRPVPKKYARLYQEVRALAGNRSAAVADVAGRAGAAAGPADSTSPLVIATGRARASEALSDEGVQAIDAYIQQVNDIDVRTQASKAIWTVHVGLPRPKLAQFERLGLTLAQAMEQTRAASAAYASTLNDAQEQLSALAPPPGFERYHALTQRGVNLERLVAELMLTAVRGEAPDRRMLKAAMRAWRRFGRGSAVEKTQERRQREYGRALKTSRYRAVRRKTERS